jgi:hypothetical protein
VGAASGIPGARRAFRALLVAWLLAAAGCSGLAGPVDPGPTPTVSPAPVPTVAPSASGPGTVTPTATTVRDRSIPVPGVRAVEYGLRVNESRIRVNATRLGRAHERALDRAGSYRRTVTLTVRTGDGTVLARDHEVVLAERAAGRYLIVETPRLAPGPFDEPVDYERFVADGTRHSYRRFANGTTRIDRRPAAAVPERRWRVSGPDLAAFLARGALRGASLGDEGAPDRYVLVGRFADPPSFGLVSDPAGGRLSVTLRADGLIRGFRLTYRGRSGQQPVAVVLSVTHERLGRTVVDRPAWLPPAEGTATTAATAAANATASAAPSPQSSPSSSRVRRWR